MCPTRLSTAVTGNPGLFSQRLSEWTESALVGRAVSEFDQAAVVGFLWIIMLVTVVFVSLVALPTSEEGYTFGDVLFEAASAQGNVGLSTEITNPSMPTSVKLVFVASMWIGRLEIIPVLVTVRVLFRGFR